MTETVEVVHAERVGGWCKPTVFPLCTHHSRAGVLEPAAQSRAVVKSPVYAA